MKAVLWHVEGRQAENCLDRIHNLCHQMDSSGGLVKALVGSEVGCRDRFVLVTFWKDWDNVTRYLGSAKSDMLPALGSPHHFEIIWQFPREEASASHTGDHVVIFDVYADDGAADTVLEHLRAGAGRLGHEPGLASAAIWIERNNTEHMLLATHWSGEAVPDGARIEEHLMLDSDGVRVTEKRVNVYRVEALGAVSTP